MRFLGLPTAGAWALIAGVAALVLALYLLKPSARRLFVASALVWERVLRQRKRHPERWRWWLSLLLAGTIALSIAAAITRPEVAAVSGTATDVVLVLDTSASMAARGADRRTRLEHAIQRAEQLIAATGAGSRYLIADTTRQVVTPAFETREAARKRLVELAPTYAAAPWFPDVAAPLDAGERLQSWFITDGVAQLAVPRGTQVISVFQLADNVGITAFEVRAAPSNPRQHAAYVQISNASVARKRVELKLSGVGGAPIVRELELPGEAVQDLVVDVSAFNEGPMRAAVRTDIDALALDDAAYAYLGAKGRVRVALISAGNPELERSLRGLPRVELSRLPAGSAPPPGRFDALVYDRYVPPRPPPAPALLVGPQAASWLPRRDAEVVGTWVAHWDGAHPLLANVSLHDVLVERTSIPASGAAAPGTLALQTVARGPRGEPLLFASLEGRRLVILGFTLEESNFAWQASFPAFLANAVNWLTSEPGALAYSIGQVRLPLQQARVLDLDGREVATRRLPGATLFEAGAPGLYTAFTAQQRVRVAVNALDARITRINEGRFQRATPPPPAPRAIARAGADPWVALLVVAVLLLALEWWTYHRRVTL